MAVSRIMRPTSTFAFASISFFFFPAAVTASSSTCRSSSLFSSNQQCSAYSTAALSGSVSYRIAVSYCGKGRKVQAHRDVHALDLIALRSKGQTAVAGNPPRSGQDAYFMGSLGNTTAGDVAFGIADGVGGWTESGIDPSAFSEGLCRHMAETAGAWDEEGKEGRLGPKRLLQSGYDRTTRDPDIDGGGSTACVAIGRTSGDLEVANLGDSGFAHYRPNAMAFFSPPQIHAFNTPYQLSLIPAEMMRQYENFGGKPLTDLPRDAAISRHNVRHGDVLIFGTDGVWDNLNSSDVLDIVRKEMEAVNGWVIDRNDNDAAVGGDDLAEKTEWYKKPGQKPGPISENNSLVSIQEKLAFKIVQRAQMAAVDMKRMSPFGRELQRWYPGESWQGGKVDDVAVICAIVVSA